jgi:chromosome segregation ATPase
MGESVERRPLLAVAPATTALARAETLQVIVDEVNASREQLLDRAEQAERECDRLAEIVAQRNDEIAAVGERLDDALERAEQAERERDEAARLCVEMQERERARLFETCPDDCGQPKADADCIRCLNLYPEEHATIERWRKELDR